MAWQPGNNSWRVWLSHWLFWKCLLLWDPFLQCFDKIWSFWSIVVCLCLDRMWETKHECVWEMQTENVSTSVCSSQEVCSDDFRCPLNAVATATCVIANLRCSKTKSLSLAESWRGVNHYLQRHTSTRRDMMWHMGPTKVSSRRRDWSRQKTSNRKAQVHYCSMQRSFAPFTGFVYEVSHRVTGTTRTDNDWQPNMALTFFRVKL